MGARRIKTRERSIDSDLTRRAVSALAAAHAGATPDVVGFRQTVLKDKLLPAAGIAEWVERQRRMDARGAPPARHGEKVEGLAFGNRQSVPVCPGGILDRLRELSELLEKSHSWTPEAATDFVLAGKTPVVTRAKASFRENLTFPRLSRITLQVDPSLTPREVMNIYRVERAKAVQGRQRAIGVKSSQMVIFHVELLPERLTWRQEMERWNRKWPRNPEYRFKHETNYAKRISAAVGSLLMAPYRVWVGSASKQKKGSGRGQ